MKVLFDQIWELNDEIFRLADVGKGQDAEIKNKSILLSNKLVELAKELEIELD